MKALLAHYAERIDAATLRQRLLVFLAASAVLLLLANALLLQPQRAKQRRLAAETAQVQKSLADLQAQIGRVVSEEANDPDSALRKRQEALRAELGQVSSRIAGEERRFTAPERMRAVLQEMLARDKRLALVDLRTLPVVPIAPQAAAGAPAGMFRHGMELTVRGTYDEIYDYLRQLENLPSQLYWARAELTVTDQPFLTLKLTVHTISFDRAWLVV
jgi:MSHA biogenesis protein MshJ